MASIEAAGKTSRTLAHRMTQGRLPLREALRYGLLLGEDLRRIHESGVVHGGLTPGCVNLTSDGIEIVPSLERTSAITAYTAPEILLGRPAGTPADIFAFGAIFFEMMTGRPAFRGGTPQELAAAIGNGAPVTTGNPAVDRVISPCLSRNPALRYPRAQRVLLELKLLVIALRREYPAARDPRENTMAVIQAELRQVEARLAARLERIERAFQELRERLERARAE